MVLAAAGRAGVIYTLSSLSTTSLEDVAAAAPDTTLWFQLYIYRDRYQVGGHKLFLISLVKCSVIFSPCRRYLMTSQ